MWFLACIVLVFFLAGLAILYSRLRIAWIRWRTARTAALNIFNSLMADYPDRHERALVSAEDFPALDRSFYDENQEAFEALGYRFVADIEDLFMTRRNPERRTMMRYMISADDTDYLAIFVLVPGGNHPAMHILQITSEFEDGTIVMTTTAPYSGMSFPPKMLFYHAPPATSPEALMNLHKQHRYAHLSAHPGKVVHIETVDDLLVSQARQTKMKHDFRKALGFGWTDSEKRFFMQGRNPDLMNAIIAELDRLSSKARTTGPNMGANKR